MGRRLVEPARSIEETRLLPAGHAGRSGRHPAPLRIPGTIWLFNTKYKRRTTVQKIKTFLWYNDQAEEAAGLYVSIFKNSKIKAVQRYGEAGPGPKGSAMTVEFILEGQEFIALNGGPHYTFTPAISLFVNCESQVEVDDLWDKLSAGGRPDHCGWLQDKFGLSWQIIPTTLMKLLSDTDPQKSARVMKAMLQMSKIDIAALKRAYEES
jgi:predicted 3-demethylubiquinone-9 3-methyltransferase (glyoxalase superfamily)